MLIVLISVRKGDGEMDEIMDIKYQENLLTEIIIKCIIQVHKILGPGFLENIYRKALLI